MVNFPRILNSLAQDQALVDDFLGQFLSNSDATRVGLLDALACGRPEELQHHLHRYRGMIAHLHADTLLALIEQIQVDLVEGRKPGPDAWAVLFDAHDEVTQEVRNYLHCERRVT